MKRAIDLNADLGEDPAAIADGTDAALLDVVTSANVACGAHAGGDATMRATVRLAKARGVAVGAHPGYADRERFGRTALDLTPEEVEGSVAAQIERLGRIAREEGVALTHVKPHGALYHAAMRRAEVAQALARAARRWSRGLRLVGQAGAAALDLWRAAGVAVVAEGFADRRYEPDGSLRARSSPGALLTTPAEAGEQAVRLAGAVDSICVHSDTPGAPAIARAVRAALERAGFAVRSP